MELEIRKDVIYRCIGTDFTNGILACGYMPKPQKEQSQYNFLIDYYSCFLLLSGRGFYYTEDSTKIPIHTGDFIQRLPGICHSTEIIPDGNWLEFFISFGRTTYDYLCSLNVLPTDTPIMKVNFDDSTIHRFSRFLEQLKKATDAELPYLLLKAQEIVLSIVDCTQKNYSEYSLKEVMDEACRLLSSEINTTISLEDVALTLHMSYENFRKQFRRFIGLSPSQYRIQQKMKHAKLMLLSGISIKETAFLTGYSDTYSFTKQFTHSVGISPGRYKQMS
jgi:AraC-like DNA-binding protein